MKKRIAVIGVGSAGLLTLTHFCTWLSNDWEVYSIHNPAKKILGIGESTNGGFVGLLERGTHFALGHEEDLDALDATLKFGSRFLNWREQDWLNPLLDGNTAIHFNSFKFKEFVHERLEKIWPKQFRVIEGDVKSLENHPDHVTVNIDGEDHNFDYVVDCMGFPPEYDDYIMSECTPVNRCLIHSIHPYEYKAETDHIATKNGWMFGVPLKSRKTYGYLYNDEFTTQAEARADMEEILGVEGIGAHEYAFKVYYAKEMMNGRICRNGNKALFFEPLVANSIFLYIYAARLFFDHIINEVEADQVNDSFTQAVQEMEDVISYYYKGGSIYESEFWDYATKMTKKRLKKRKPFKELMKGYRKLKRNGTLHEGRDYAYAPITWEIVDKALGYKSF